MNAAVRRVEWVGMAGEGDEISGLTVPEVILFVVFGVYAVGHRF